MPFDKVGSWRANFGKMFSCLFAHFLFSNIRQARERAELRKRLGVEESLFPPLPFWLPLVPLVVELVLAQRLS